MGIDLTSKCVQLNYYYQIKKNFMKTWLYFILQSALLISELQATQVANGFQE